MPEPDVIFSLIARRLERDSTLSGMRVVVTAGATREPIDPVRFISNHSSGRMGVAIADAARRRGAEVTLVAGHLEVAAPIGVRRIDASTVDEMRDAVASSLSDADVLIMAAAPADFRPSDSRNTKIKKDGGFSSIELSPTDDILASTAASRKKNAVIVGFALETQDLLKNAKAKLEKKNLDMIVANDATEEGAGFRVSTNRVTLITRDGKTEEIPLMQKTEVAELILDRVEQLLNGRAG
jgi:phosphopantothenoylcysteine decarboxylase/phosphopantothenate--cysteine ligase